LLNQRDSYRMKQVDTGPCHLVNKAQAVRFVEHIELLKKLAAKSPLLHKHGACLIKGGKLQAIGVNKFFQIRFDNTSYKIGMHAEIDALSACNSKLSKGMDILVIRLSKSNELQYSRPCSSCIDKLQQRGIRKAYYSIGKEEIAFEYVDSMPKIHTSSGNSLRSKLASKNETPGANCVCVT